MATTNANGDIVDAPSADLSGLLGAVLGKEVEQNTNSNQNTSGTTTGTTTNNQQTSSNQAVQGSQATSQQNTGSTATQGTNQTTGSTVNTGTQATTGTINTQNTGSTDTTQVTRTDADLTGLQTVFKQQQAGITPEMLAAIFQQGAKAAPQLAVATSNALGARASGNTPMAQSLNQLNLDLTSKAADLNRQMLADSGTTAGKIADLSKTSSTTGTQQQNSLSSQIQDLLAKNDTTSIVNQLVATLNNQQTVANQTGQTVNAQNTQASGQTNTQGTSAATQEQQVTATQQQETKTTINTSVAKSLAGMALAGIGVNELFKLATGKGFIGNLTDFAVYLKGAIASTGSSASPGYFGDSAPGETPGYNDDYGPGETPGTPDTPPADDFVPDPQAGFADGGVVTPKVGTKGPVKTGGTGGGLSAEALNAALAKSSNSPAMVRETPGGGQIPRVRAAEIKSGIGYADGGAVPFLPIEQLIKKQQIINNPDSDIENMLANMGGDNGSYSSGGSGGSGGVAPGTTNGESAGGGAGAGVGVNDSSQTPTTVADTSPIGNVGKTVAGIIGAIIGLPPGVAGLAVAAINAANAATGGNPNGMGTPTPSVSVGAIEAPSDAPGMVSEDGEDPDSSGGIGPGTGTGGNSPDGTSTGGPGGDGNDAGVGYADGGEVDEDHEEMLQLFGITRGKDKGSLVFNTDAVSRMHRALSKNSSNPPGKANGGRQIKGPGTGVSDSIPANGPNGPIRVADGEYIIPTDVVQKFGVGAFDQLVADHHVPAEMQRAITGE